jgi:hypothetical protein
VAWDDKLLTRVAAETPETSTKRKKLQELLKELEASLEDLENP